MIDTCNIAKSFPGKFDTKQLSIEISSSGFKIFEDGIFATCMDEKWNVFVLDDIIYFARSWTNFCIYKVFVKRLASTVLLSYFQVNRDDNQYQSKDINNDTILLKKLLQMFLKREDIYSDPALELPLIKETIERIDPNNDCKKSIGSNLAGVTKQIYNGLSTTGQQQYFSITGWTELEKKISGKPDHEPLISLYLHNRQQNTGTTIYFDKDANELLGQITIHMKPTRLSDLL